MGTDSSSAEVKNFEGADIEEMELNEFKDASADAYSRTWRIRLRVDDSLTCREFGRTESSTRSWIYYMLDDAYELGFLTAEKLNNLAGLIKA